MNKLKIIAVASTLLISAPSFAKGVKVVLPALAGIREVNNGKTAELKVLKMELKKLKEQEQVVKLQERSKRLDDQIAEAKAKLADARGLQ